MEESNPKRKLHEALSSPNVEAYTKSFEEFDKQFSNEESVSRLFDAVSEAELYTKTEDEFVDQFFPELKKKERTESPFPSATMPNLASGEGVATTDATTTATQQELPQDVVSPPLRKLSSKRSSLEGDAREIAIDIYTLEQRAKDESLTEAQRENAKQNTLDLRARQSEILEEIDKVNAKMKSSALGDEISPEDKRVLEKEYAAVSKMIRSDIFEKKQTIDNISSSMSELEDAVYLIATTIDGSDIEKPENVTDEQVQEFNENLEKLKSVNARIEAGEKGENIIRDHREVEEFSISYNQMLNSFNKYIELSEQLEQSTGELNENIGNYIRAATPVEESSLDIKPLMELSNVSPFSKNPAEMVRALHLQALSNNPLFLDKNTNVTFPELSSILGKDISMTKEAYLNEMGYSLDYESKLSDVELTAFKSSVNTIKNLFHNLPATISLAESGVSIIPEYVLQSLIPALIPENEENEENQLDPGAPSVASLLVLGARAFSPMVDKFMSENPLEKRRDLLQNYSSLVGSAQRPTVGIDDMLESKGLFDGLFKAQAFAFNGMANFVPSIAVASLTAGYGLVPLFIGTSAEALDRGAVRREAGDVALTNEQRNEVVKGLREQGYETNLPLAILAGTVMSAAEYFGLKSLAKSLQVKTLSGSFVDLAKNFALFEPSRQTGLNIFEVLAELALGEYEATGGDMKAVGENILEFLTSKKGAEVILETYMGTFLMGGGTVVGRKMFSDKGANQRQFNIYNTEEHLTSLLKKSKTLQGDDLSNVQEQIRITQNALRESKQDLNDYVRERGRKFTDVDVSLYQDEIKQLGVLNQKMDEYSTKIIEAQEIENAEVRDATIEMYEGKRNEAYKQLKEVEKLMEQKKEKISKDPAKDPAKDPTEGQAKIDEQAQKEQPEADDPLVSENDRGDSAGGDAVNRKNKQLEIINKENPAPDDISLWVRKVEDIKTADDVFAEAEEEGAMYPDFTAQDMSNALNKGEVTVYSSYPIKNGVFVSPSKMNAEDYAGGKGGKTYSKVVKLEDVAWLDEGDGQYAKVEQSLKEQPKAETKADVDTKTVEQVERGDTKQETAPKQETLTTDQKQEIAQEIGKSVKTKPKNIKDLINVMSDIFGLNKKQSESAAVIGDAIISNAAKRAGITKDEMYQRLAFAKAQIKDVKGSKRMLFQGKEVEVKPVNAEVVNGLYSPLEKIINETQFAEKNTELRAELNKAQKELQNLFKAKKGNTNEANNLKEQVAKLKEQIAKSEQKTDDFSLSVADWKAKFENSEEANWTGLTDWLNQQQGRVSKADIQNYLKENRVEIVGVMKGDGKESEQSIKDKITSKGYELESDMGDGGYVILKDGEYAEYDKLPQDVKALYDQLSDIVQSEDGSDTKFSGYQLEGEKENYKEVLVTLPVKFQEVTYSVVKGDRENPYKVKNNVTGGVMLGGFRTKERANEYAKSMTTSRYDTKSNFQSSHFDEPNILVHLRMNTRTDAQGNKVLFLEEVQSDWGQKGKKEGFIETEQEYQKRLSDAISKQERIVENEADKQKRLISSEKEDHFNNVLQKERAKLRKLKSVGLPRNRVVPTAPFVTDTNAWTKLGLKVALKEAIAQGADKIAWTTGEQQIVRYDLRKQVDSIEYFDRGDEGYSVVGIKNGNQLFSEIVKSDKLEASFGKDVAQRIQNNEGERGVAGAKVLKGNDLSVGGKGMKGFYGNPTDGSKGIVGGVAEKLTGQKVGTVEIDAINNERKINAEMKLETKKDVVESFKQKIKESRDAGNTSALKELLAEAEREVEIQQKVVNKEQALSTQHSIDITSELRMSVMKGLPLFQGAKGAMVAEDINYIIYALANPNVSTPLHEIAHVYEHYLTETERKKIKEWSGHESGTIEFSESFAKGFEKYLADGEAPTPALQKYFDNFKQWLLDIYNGITNSEIDLTLNKEMKAIYADMVTPQKEQQKTQKDETRKADGLADKSGEVFPIRADEAPIVSTKEEADREIQKIEREQRKLGRVGFLPISDIEVRSDIFQFKEADEDSGVNLNEKLHGEYDPNTAQAIAVWMDEKGEIGEAGKTYVVDGHHRVDFAKRSGVKDMAVFYIEAETAAGARLAGAKANIAQGRGTSIDAAKVYRESSSLGYDLSKFTPPSNVAKEGLALSRLSDALFNAVVNESIPIKVGVIIGENIADKDAQEQFWRSFRNRNLTQQKIRIAAEDFSQAKTKKVDGDIQMDMFGETAKQKVAYEERLSAVSGITNILKKTKNFLGSAARGKDFLEKYGNQIDVAQSEGVSAEASQALGVFNTLRNSHPIKGIIDRAVDRVEKGEKKKDVYSDAANEIVNEALPEILGKPVIDKKAKLEESKAKLKASIDKAKNIGIMFDQRQQAAETMEIIQNLAEYIKLSGELAFEKVKTLVNKEFGDAYNDGVIRAAIRAAKGKPTPRERVVQKMADAQKKAAETKDIKEKAEALKDFANQATKLGRYSVEDMKQDAKDFGVKMTDEQVKTAYKSALNSNELRRQRLLDKIEKLQNKYAEFKQKTIEDRETRRGFKQQVDGMLSEAKAQGYVTANEALSIAKQAAAVTTEKKLGAFTDRVDRILQKAQNKEQLKEARKARKAVRKAKNTPKQFDKAIAKFSSINPTNVSDIQDYIDLGNSLAKAINPKVKAADKMSVSEIDKLVDALSGEAKENRAEQLSERMDVSFDEAMGFIDEYGNENFDGYVRRQAEKMLKDEGEDVNDKTISAAMAAVEAQLLENAENRDKKKEAFRSEMMQDLLDVVSDLIEDGVIPDTFKHLTPERLTFQVMADMKGLFDTMLNDESAKPFGLKAYLEYAKAHRDYDANVGEVNVKRYKGKSKTPFRLGLNLDMYLTSIVVDQWKDAPILSKILGWKNLRESTKKADVEIHENVVKKFNALVDRMNKKYSTKGKTVRVNTVENSAASQVYAIFEQQEQGVSDSEHTKKTLDALKAQVESLSEERSLSIKYKAQMEAAKNIIEAIGEPKTIAEAHAALLEAYPFAKELSEGSSKIHNTYKSEIEDFHVLELGEDVKMVDGNYNTIKTIKLSDVSAKPKDQDQISLFEKDASSMFRTKSIKPKETQGIHFERTENRNMSGRIFDLDFFGIQQAHLSDSIREMRTYIPTVGMRARINNPDLLSNELDKNSKIIGEIKRLAENFYLSSNFSQEELNKMQGYNKAIQGARMLRNKATRLVLFTGRQFFIQAVPQTALNIVAFASLPILMDKSKGASAKDIQSAMLNVSLKMMSDGDFRRRIVSELGKDKRSYVETHIRAKSKQPMVSKKMSDKAYYQNVIKALEASEKLAENYDKYASAPLRFGDSVTVQHGAVMLAAAEAVRQGDESVKNLDTWTPSETQIEFSHQTTRGMFSADTQRELAPIFKSDSAAKMFINDALGFLIKYPMNKVFEFSKQISHASHVTVKNGYTKEQAHAARRHLTFNGVTWATESVGYAYTSVFLWNAIIDGIISPVINATAMPLIKAFVSGFQSGDLEEIEDNMTLLEEFMDSQYRSKMFGGKLVESVLPLGSEGVVNTLNRADYLRYRSTSKDPYSYAEWKRLEMEKLSVFTTDNNMLNNLGAYGVSVQNFIRGAEMFESANDGLWRTRSGNDYVLDDEGVTLAKILATMNIATSISPMLNMGGATQAVRRELNKTVVNNNLFKNQEHLAAYIYMSEKDKDAALKAVKEMILANKRDLTEVQRAEGKIEREIESVGKEAYLQQKSEKAVNSLMKTSPPVEGMDIRDYRQIVIDENEYIRFGRLDRKLNSMTAPVDKAVGRRSGYQLQAEYIHKLVNDFVDSKQYKGEVETPGALTELKIVMGRYAKMEVMGSRDAEAFIDAYYGVVADDALRKSGYKGSLKLSDIDYKELKSFIEDKGHESITEEYNSFFAEKALSHKLMSVKKMQKAKGN